MSLDEGIWRTSSYSNQSGGECVQARLAASATVDLRDSAYPADGHLAFPGAEWRAFLAEVRDGRL